MAKYWCGLSTRPVVDTTNLLGDLNTPEALSMQFDLFSEAITILKNERELLPLRALDSIRIASVVIGDRKVQCVSGKPPEIRARGCIC